MRLDTLEVLRCPYCGGRLELVTASFHRVTAPRSTTASSAATAASFRSSTASRCCTCTRRRPAPRIRSRPGGPIWRGARCSASTTTAPAKASTRSRRRRHGDLPRYRRGARARLRGRLLPLSLLRSRPTSSRNAVVRAVAPDGALAARARDRHLRRIGPSDAVAAGSVVAAAGARGPVLREGLAGAAVHRAGLRAGVLRRQRADAVRARRVRLRDVRRRVHVHLDEAAVRRRDGAARRRRAKRRGGR